MDQHLSIKTLRLGKVFQFATRARNLGADKIGLILLRIAGLPVRLPEMRNPVAALDDVSIEVARGEVVCLVGPARSGKTTLLRILGGATLPTSGEAWLRGRVAALYDVKEDLDRHLTVEQTISRRLSIGGSRGGPGLATMDEILAFADLARFRDVPTGKLSTGMQMRLSVALVLSGAPDVVLLDDVLATGDVSFTAKVVDRLKALREAGTAAIVVSTDSAFVSSAGTRTLALNGGRIVDFTASEMLDGGVLEARIAAGEVRNELAGIRLVSLQPFPATGGRQDLEAVFALSLAVPQSYRPLVDVTLEGGAVVMRTVAPAFSEARTPGTARVTLVLPTRHFGSGSFTLDAILISVVDGRAELLRAPGMAVLRVVGETDPDAPLAVDLDWEIDYLAAAEASP